MNKDRIAGRSVRIFERMDPRIQEYSRWRNACRSAMKPPDVVLDQG
jgi:hypothetical protein